MKKTTGAWSGGVAACCLAVVGCSDPQSSQPTVERASEALINAPDAGGNPSTVVFATGTPQCTGVAVGPQLVLTTTQCAVTRMGLSATPTSITLGFIRDTADANFDQTFTPMATSQAISTTIHLVRLTAAPPTGTTNPTYGQISFDSPTVGTQVRVSGIQPGEASGDRRSILANVESGTGGAVCAETPGEVHFDVADVDEGAAVFNTNGTFAGFLGAGGGCNQTDRAPIVRLLNLVVGTGDFDPGSGSGNVVPFLWVLGGDRPMYEFQVYFGSGVYRADTGIPKGLQSLFAQGTLPIVTTGTTSTANDLALPQTKDSSGVADTDGISDIVVSVGPFPSSTDPTDIRETAFPVGAGDGSGDEDDRGESEDTPLTLNAALGMKYVLSGADVIGTLAATEPQQSFKGFPSSDGRDGRYLTIGGTGFATSRVTTFNAHLQCPAAEPVRIDVFDADTSNAGQPNSNYDNNTDPLDGRTCLRLIADPDLEGTDEALVTDPDCRMGTVEANGNFPDDAWFPFVNAASPLPNCTATAKNYLLQVTLLDQADSGTCDDAVPGDPGLEGGGLEGVQNLFKIRSNCEILVMKSEFTTFNNDEDGDIYSKASGGNIVRAVDTTLDRHGTFGYVVNTASVGTPNACMILRNVDADDCDTFDCTTQRNAGGRSRGLHFLPFGFTTSTTNTNPLLSNQRVTVPPNVACDDDDPQTGVQPDGWALNPGTANILEPTNGAGNSSPTLAGEDPANPTGTEIGQALRYQNPSGNFDGVPDVNDDNDVGEFRQQLGAATEVAVLWRSMRAMNAMTHFAPTGSPIVFPVTSGTSVWRSAVQARTVAGWLADPTALAAAMVQPLEVGIPGGMRSATNVAEAQALLNDPSALLTNLTAAALNERFAATQSVTLSHGTLRGSDTLLSDVIRRSSEVFAGVRPPGNELTELVGLNDGLFLFNAPDPEFAPLEDEDGDGIVNVDDNCPPVPNEDQENTVIFDDLGDACDPTPIVECVVRRGGTKFTAYFGYDNPFRRRTLAGSFNAFTTAPANRGQPTQQLPGRHTNVFSVDSTGAPLSWQLAGNTATATLNSPACTGAEITIARVNERVALLATQRLEAKDRFQMVNFDAMAAGPGGVLIGFGPVAKTGDISATGGVEIRNRVLVGGSIRANGPIILPPASPPADAAIVQGIIQTPAGVVLDDIGLSIPQPPSRANLNNPPSDFTVAPGNYNTLSMPNNGTLRLRAGLYDFNSLTLGTDNRLIVDDSAGLVRVVIRRTFGYDHRSATSSTGGGHPQLLIMLTQPPFGVSPFTELRGSFSGSIVGVGRDITLFDRISFNGTLFARNIIAGFDTFVKYVALGVPAEPVPPPMVTATVVIDNDWGGGYCADLFVTNHNSVPTTNWSVSLNTNESTIYTNWNGIFSGSSGMVGIAPGFSWNMAIPAGATNDSVGFCANRTVPGSGTAPSVVSASGTF